MRIILNSYEKTIRERRDDRDTSLTQYEKEADVLNIIAFAVASYAKRYFKTETGQNLWIGEITDTALKMLPCIENVRKN